MVKLFPTSPADISAFATQICNKKDTWLKPSLANMRKVKKPVDL